MLKTLTYIRSFFRLEERGSNLSREVVGGVTTFVTMAYIIFVNPTILGDPNGAQMDMGAVMVATVLAAGLTSVTMGLFANLPVALAPGMGMNAFFSFTICQKMGVRWETALGIVVVSGVIFLMLSAFRFRERIISAVPDCLKYAAAAGIGLFIAFIGFKYAGIIVPDGATFVTFGPLYKPPVLLALFGLVVTGILVAFGIRAGILIGVVVTGLLGVATGIIKAPQGFEANLGETFLKADIKGALALSMILPILTFLFFDMFDTVGTLMGVSEAAGLVDEEGRIPNAGRALATDAAGTVLGGLLGTSTTTSYIESAAGVASGARTGLAAVVTGLLFLLSWPLLKLRVLALFASAVPLKLDEAIVLSAPGGGAIVGNTMTNVAGSVVITGTTLFIYPATAAALIIVGFQMVKVLPRIKWNDVTEGLPAFLTVIIMPLTFSISEGLAVGFISYVILKLVRGKIHQVHPLLYVISGAIVVGYVAGKLM